MTMLTEPIARLRRDIRQAANTLTTQEARYLVDSYYIMQDDRKRAHNQVRALGENAEPHSIISWLADNSRVLEGEIKTVLDVYSENHPVGRWMKSIYGIGPVIAAGFLAHINIEIATSAGKIWRFAGLDPTVKWEAGKKRPWNAELKTLCWKLGQSFMKFSNAEECIYGHMYRKRKHEYEIPRNESGRNAERCKQILSEKKWNPSTEAFKHLSSGKLPPAQIDGMARRHVVKLFLSHLHLVWRHHEFGHLPGPLAYSVPYAIAILGHKDFIAPPNLEDHFPELLAKLRRDGFVA